MLATRRLGTATKTATLVLEMPQSVSTVTRDQLGVQNVQRLREAIRSTPGVVAEPRGVASRQTFRQVDVQYGTFNTGQIGFDVGGPIDAEKKLLYRLVADGGADLGASFDLQSGGSVTFGIRPEHIHVGEAGVEASVLLMEPTGAETVLQLQIGKTPVTAVMRERITADVGDVIKLAFDPVIHLFDPGTEMRIGI